MTTGTRPTALLDANVLYPAPVRDILLHFADAGLFLPKWTKQIQEEWTRNLLANRTDLKKPALDKTIAAMNNAFPDANITRYGSLVMQLTLPDADDRHVLAAAIKGQVSHIVTANIKDFPSSVIKNYNIQMTHPDIFLANLIEGDTVTAIAAFDRMVAKLKRPPLSYQEVQKILVRCGLPKTVQLLVDFLEV